MPNTNQDDDVVQDFFDDLFGNLKFRKFVYLLTVYFSAYLNFVVLMCFK